VFMSLTVLLALVTDRKPATPAEPLDPKVLDQG